MEDVTKNKGKLQQDKHAVVIPTECALCQEQAVQITDK